jgi:ACR3 family arsenite transporter
VIGCSRPPSLLLIAQMLLLLGFVLLFLGPDLADIVESKPFVEAFSVFIAGPLTLAWLTQVWAPAARPGDCSAT